MSRAVPILRRGWSHDGSWGLLCQPWRSAGPWCQGWVSLSIRQTQHWEKSVTKDNSIQTLFGPGWNMCEGLGKRLETRARAALHAKVLISTCFLRRIRVNSGCYQKPDGNLCRYNTSLNIFLPTTFPVCCSFYFNYCIPNDLPFSQQDRKILKDPRSNLWAIIWFSFLAVCAVPISVTLEHSSPQCR